VHRTAKNRSEKKPRLKIPLEIAAAATIRETGTTHIGFPLVLCLACSTFFLYGKKNLDSVDQALPNFCPNCGRERARKNQETSGDG
jgi:hypothetical protein